MIGTIIGPALLLQQEVMTAWLIRTDSESNTRILSETP